MKINYSGEISRSPFLLHGTNILAVLNLFETGYLTPSQKEGLKGKFHFAYTRLCSQSRGLREEGYTKREAVATARDYGSFGGREYLFEYLGYPIKDFISLVSGKINYRYVLQEDNCLSPKEARDIVSRIYAFRGVILEPSDAIFDFKFFYGDDFHDLAFHFPCGLPDFLIKTLFPSGDVERKILAGGRKKLDKILGI